MRRILCGTFLACLCVGYAWGQEVASTPASASTLSPPPTIALTVPVGATLQVALEKEVRVKKVGQPIHGLLVEPVYAFDREVIPVGSEVMGRVSEIEGLSGKTRLLAALNANFSPTRRTHVEFDEIILPEGRHLLIETVVTPGSGRVLQLVTTADKKEKKTPTGAASRKMKEAVAEADRKWRSAMAQIKEPGKMRRLARFAVAQLPVHPHYLDAGTVYFLELMKPLDFGSLPLTPPTSREAPSPSCSLLAHARLVTPLSSATVGRDAPVEALLSQPVFSGDRLVFPEGSLLQGSVAEAQPARRFGRNGKLRIRFRELALPHGMGQRVNASLEGVQADQGQQVRLDVESGAQSTSPKKRFLLTGLAVTLAVASYPDSPDIGVSSSSGNARPGAAGGAAGFGLVGILVGAFVRSQPLALAMGLYGAGRSGYSHFLARGRDVVFPKGTAMEIGFWLAGDCSDSAKPD